MTSPASRWLRRVGDFLKDLLIVTVGALLASTMLRLFVMQMFVIPSGSMENTLMIGDRVMVQKVSQFKRGDVVVFRDTQGWLGAIKDDTSDLTKALIFVGLVPDMSSNHLIKRVIGLPGDRVRCCDPQGRITINGTALNETSYLFKDSSSKQVLPSDFAFDVVVPAGKIFVMGDHRNNSQDSRCHLDDRPLGRPVGATAFIPIEDVVGSAVAIAFPFHRFKGMGQPDAFTLVGEPTSAPPTEAIIGQEKIRC